MFIGWSSTKFVILVQIGNPTWLPGPIMCSDWLKLWKSSCQKLRGRWNCNIIEKMTGWSSTKFVIFVPIAYPRWPPQGNNSLPLDPMGISFKDLFLRNYLTNWIFCIMWMFLGWFYTWSIILVQIGNPTWLPEPIMCSDWLKLWKSSCQKLRGRWNCNIIEKMTGWSSTKFVIFVPIAYPRWPPQGNNSLPLDPMGISFKDLFLRNYLTNWIFCIMWMFLGWFYTWSIILVQIGNPTWLPGPIMCSNWLKLWRSSCQKLLGPWNCYIIEMMTGWSSTNLFILCGSEIQNGRHQAIYFTIGHYGNLY